MNQYDKDNYIHFNSFTYYGAFSGNSGKIPPISQPTDRINLPNTFPVLGNQFTLEAMFYSKPNPLLTSKGIIGGDAFPSKITNESPPTITLNKQNGVNQIRYGFGIGPDSKRKMRKINQVINDNTWHHVAFTFDGTTTKLYVDGNEVDSSDLASGLTPHPVPISIIGNNFLGKMDEVRIWNIPRTQTDIQSTMNGTLSGNETGLLAYYPMDVNENWELIDHSPNENHASIVDAEILQKYSSQNCDSPDGSSLCPFPKIRDALEVAQGGDNILVKEGRYSEVLFNQLINNSYETEDLKLTITGENDNVKLDGTIELNANWEYTNGRYVAQVDMNDISKRAGIEVEEIYALWVNDRYMIPAMPINFSNPTDPTTSTQNNPESGTVFDLHLTTPYYYPGPNYLELQDPYIVGDINNLDASEEWSFDKENKTLHLIAGNNIPNSTNVRVRIRTDILRFIQSDNIEIKNIDFFAGSFYFFQNSFNLLEDLKVSHSWEAGMSYQRPAATGYIERGNIIKGGINNTIRNVIFEYINDARALSFANSPNPLIENVFFRHNDWFENTVWAPSVSDNFRGSNKWYDPGVTIGGSTFRYITMDQNHTGGIQPGLRSLVEYARIRNQYINIDGSGIQRTTGNTIKSTTRYSWLLNTNRNGMRWDSSCAGVEAVVHNVVSAGNKRNFRLKGDKHRAFHLLAYDSNTVNISLPKNKFCGENWGNQGKSDANMLGNVNSRLLNSIAERALGANTPDAGDLSITGGDGDLIAKKISNEFLLNQSGIWYGRALDEDHAAPFIFPHLELQDPWFENRTRSTASLESQFGVNPYKDANQDYDFRPRKGSTLIDGGVVIPGINDGQDDDPSSPFNHPPSYSGQHRAFVGDAPDIGPYEYGDSVYWIPGFRFSYPSVPIPSNGAVDVPIDYSVMFNYPWKTDYSNISAIVNITGPGININKTLNYPENVVFANFIPGKTYNWTVTVDGVSSDNWTFTVTDKIHPLNDNFVDITAEDQKLIPNHNKNLQVADNVLSFLRFDIPESIDVSDKIYLNITPGQIQSLNGGIVLYKYNYQGWGEKLNEKNLGIIDHSLLTTLQTISSLESGSEISIDVSQYIDSAGEYSFALGPSSATDQVSFYSKEKYITDGIDVDVSAGDLLGDNANGSGYAPQIDVWPSLSFVDTKKPVITIIGDTPMTIEVGSTFTDPGATATDNYDGNVTVTSAGTVDANTVGTYTLTYTATDSSNNTLSDTRTVNVVDTTPPNLLLNGDAPMTIDVGSTFTDPGATATDNYDGNVTVTTAGTVDANTVGTYTLTYTATDSNDNTTSDTRTVNVIDPSDPTIIITSSTNGVIDGSITNHSTIELTFTTSKSTSNFTESDITLGNGSLSSFNGSGKTYTAIFTPDESGACTIDVAASTFTGPQLKNNTAATQFNWTYDNVIPTVTNVTSNKEDGSYKQGGEIPITITFSEVVNVTGTPQLSLETGNSNALVNYSSGTGTDTLTFNYSVEAGHTSTDLDYVATNSLTLNSGTIKDIATNDAILTLASPGATNSLGSNKALIIYNTPVANIQSVTVDEQTAVSITLVGTDADGDNLTYSIIDTPINGTANLDGDKVTYISTSNSATSDSFSFKVNDGKEDSAKATVSITITAINDIPVAVEQNLTVHKKNSITITLNGTDPDGTKPSIYKIISLTSNGTLNDNGVVLTSNDLPKTINSADVFYTSTSNSATSDSFLFKVNDGEDDSAEATVTFSITNYVPVAVADTKTVAEDAALTSTDVIANDTDLDEDDTLSLTAATTDGTGTVAVNADGLSVDYTPAANFNGTETITYTVSDGTDTDATGTLTITVTAVNDAPVATPQSVTTIEDIPLDITLAGTDVDEDALTYALVDNPTNGTVSLTESKVTYVPSTGYFGSDSFTFKVNDGTIDSEKSTVSITITSNDLDEDGVLNDDDKCPNTPAGTPVDFDGCAIFVLPVNNNKVEVTSATCIGNTDGSIGLSVEDNSYDYTITITGKDDVAIAGEDKTASVTGLAKGTYSVCFKVDGQADYEQCFEVVIGEPKPLSAFIDVDNDKRTTSIDLSGSNLYNIDINGQRHHVKGDNFKTTLPTGLSIIKISTSLDCQGVIEREIFISEDIHYYPNPTDQDVSVHVSGEDTTVQVSVFSEKGDLIYSREQQIQDFSRKTNIDLSRQITGTYIVVMDGPTVRKTFKIIRK